MQTALKIDLSDYSDRFNKKSKEFSLSKNVNFIFGKNGTGKSTIADVIKNQFSDTYNVCVFKDFNNVIDENGRLNAIALGAENAEIQKQIDVIDTEIFEIKIEVDKPSDDLENVFVRYEKANMKYEDQVDKIDKFYIDSARIITKSLGLGRNYEKNDYKKEVGYAKLLSDDQIKQHKETIKSERKEKLIKILFPEIILLEYQKSANQLLQSSVSQKQIIQDLKDNTDKQNFAKEGLRIHKHKRDEKCAFCGNEIHEERWQLLGSYFNDEVKKLEYHIDEEMKKIDIVLSTIVSVQEIDKADFYEKFSERIKTLNLQIKSIKGQYQVYLDIIKKSLDDKKRNLFSKSNELTEVIPNSFSAIKSDYDKIIDENNQFSQNLLKEQESAKNALRFHEIKKALDAFKYDEENGKLLILKTDKCIAEKILNEKNKELDSKYERKRDLILQTKDQAKIATKINNLLKDIGVNSFSLELVSDDDENQKGQYKIKSYNGNIRSVAEMSKGEKNIIAFLYFVLSLENIKNDNTKPKIVILDDPMTSNDDTMQYLMIGEIQKLYKNFSNSSYFILLTHNVHFYLNSRKINDKFYEKYANYHLLSDGKLTTIKYIKNGNDDFCTNYEVLWKELIFLYDEGKPNLMLSSCRKICETFSKFIGTDDFFNDNIAAKKLFDVNQHSIDDLEAEQNGKSKDEIKILLQQLFIKNNAGEHFSKYWQKTT